VRVDVAPDSVNAATPDDCGWTRLPPTSWEHLQSAFAVSGIPCLLLFDGNGNFLTKDGIALVVRSSLLSATPIAQPTPAQKFAALVECEKEQLERRKST